MAVFLDVELTNRQIEQMSAIPDTTWFTQVVFRNASSPAHPKTYLEENNSMKLALTHRWLEQAVAGRRVLDLFCANGGFSFTAASLGAKQVVGIDFSQERIDCARFVASTVPHYALHFFQGDVYSLESQLAEPFDVVLCFGGLYHIADPALILRKIRAWTTERLILQTSQVLDVPENHAKFEVRRADLTAQGLTSVRGGYGTWHCSPACLRELLLHGGFSVLEDLQPEPELRSRFPWYLACCEPIGTG